MSDPTGSEFKAATIEITATEERISTTETLDLILNIEHDLKEKLPEQEQSEVLRVVREVVERRAAYFSGPQPPPEMIAEYERVAPGWGLRILEMGHREQLHRHECDLRLLAQNERDLDQGQSWLQYLGRGQWMGFAAFLIIGAIGIYALTIGAYAAASLCLGTFAVGVVGSFVRGAAPWTRSETRSGKDASQAALSEKRPTGH